MNNEVKPKRKGISVKTFVIVVVVCLVVLGIAIAAVAPTINANENYDCSNAPTGSFVDIYKAFQSNEVTAKDTYINNWYSFTATISEIHDDGTINGEKYYIKATQNGTDMNVSENVYFKTTNNIKSQISTYKVGDTISFCGKFVKQDGIVTSNYYIEHAIVK